MGRAQVRQAIANALTNAQLPYVGTVYPARPVVMAESAYTETMLGQAIQLTGSGSSAVLVVNLPGRDKRMRRSLTGRGFTDDTNVHPVAIEVFFASTPSSGLAQDAGLDAQADYDTIVDELVSFVRNNQTMGDPSAVWSAGEFRAGVTHDQDQPYTSADGLTVFIPGVVRFEVWEWLDGSGV